MAQSLWESAGSPSKDERHVLGDCTASRRLIIRSALAICLGAIDAVLPLVLLRLITFCTNLFFGRIGLRDVTPAGSNMGVLVVAIPVIGALRIGLMARFGAERFRGHGIPDAI